MLELFAVTGVMFISVSLVLGYIFDYLPQPIKEIISGVAKSTTAK